MICSTHTKNARVHIFEEKYVAREGVISWCARIGQSEPSVQVFSRRKRFTFIMTHNASYMLPSDNPQTSNASIDPIPLITIHTVFHDRTLCRIIIVFQQIVNNRLYPMIGQRHPPSQIRHRIIHTLQSCMTRRLHRIPRIPARRRRSLPSTYDKKTGRGRGVQCKRQGRGDQRCVQNAILACLLVLMPAD